MSDGDVFAFAFPILLALAAIYILLGPTPKHMREGRDRDVH